MLLSILQTDRKVKKCPHKELKKNEKEKFIRPTERSIL